ncbi:hypothetical protein Mahau_2709 [Mahella australiensis 50-1 BON]|uniref:Uncharacterized protein n=1 Tax=Mahella australiensis (strain DSM 15567 / CIP 107919 / 50-1 BON) TaxID=697281 RepID=F3ZZ63_MAHA5|nr:hypothetical protein Mahau_2709 [Mahella australiensis 50-1 BON]
MADGYPLEKDFMAYLRRERIYRRGDPDEEIVIIDC